MLRILFAIASTLTILVLGTDAMSQSRSEKLRQMINQAVREMGATSEKDEPSASMIVRETETDLAVPASPAFAVLDLTPETVIRPTSSKQFATSLLDGVDPNGNLQSGLAIQTSPYLMFGGNNLSIKKYNEKYVQRFLARAGLSIATSKGLNDDNSVRFATALTLTPWDRGDPRFWSQSGSKNVQENSSRNLVGCMGRKLLTINQGLRDAILKNDRYNLWVNIDQGDEPYLEEVKNSMAEKLKVDDFQAIQKCREGFRESAWNASAWNLGIAPTWVSPSGEVTDLEWAGAAVYSTLSYGFEDDWWGGDFLQENAQILLHARYRMDELSSDSGSSSDFFEQDSLTLAGQLRISGPTITNRDTVGGPDLNFLAEAAYVMQNRDGRPNEQFLRYSLGAEYRVSEDVYLKASIGTTDGRDESNDESFILFNLKWNLSANPTIQ